MDSLKNILPFTDSAFFGYTLVVVLLFLLAKRFLQQRLPYKLLLAATSLFYISWMFPKPIQLAGLILYTYGIYYLLGRRLKFKGLLLPVILLTLPMVFMKTLNILPSNSETGGIATLSTIFQIAGISFLTFKVIQLYIDEKDSATTVSLLDYFNFTAFVPTLLIGPIDRFGRFNENVKNGYSGINSERFLAGIDKIIRGLFYKFIVGEAILVLVLNHIENTGTWWFYIADMYAYLFYLFFDFAGYSLLAIGVGNAIGIDVPYNFDKPFLAVNPKEFWKKWHKTLGDWLNDYFFKPVFKELTSKKVLKPIQRQNVALFLTFTVMGFWNGFELHFIVSGMLFGCYSVIHNYYVYLCKKNGKDVIFGSLNTKTIERISIFILFNAVAVAIYVFSGRLF